MVVCRFYQQGNCRYGDNCKYEHPGAQGSRNTGFASQNRFSAFQSPAGGGGNDVRKDAPWSINVADLKNDFTAGIGRPQWILSTYGPGKNAPASLFDGNELSFEELRSRFYELKDKGNETQATSEANGLWTKAEQEIADVLNNVDKVVPVMQEADKKHPNRYDFLKMTGEIPKEQVIKEAESSNSFGGAFGAKPSGFGAQPAGMGSGFGGKSTSAFGSNASSSPFGSAKPSTGFGATSFGQNSQPAFGQSGFTQPSTTSSFGKPAAGAFGQPSNLGKASQPSSFGTSSFGQPAARNPLAPASAAVTIQPSQATSAFGQTSQPASGFGQPAFGQPPQPSSGFGQSSQPGGGFGQQSKPASGFGQPSQPSTGLGQTSQSVSSFAAAANPFSAFSQSSKPVATFGQPAQASSGFGQPSQVGSDFGQPSQSTSGFGQPAQSAATFGQPSQPSSTFGQPTRTGSGFGQPSQPSTANQAIPSFGQPLTSQTTDRKPSNPFGSGTTTGNPFSQPSQAASSSTDRPNPFIAPFSTASTLNNTPAPAVSAPIITSTPIASITTPHPLTSQPPAPTHYTQTLPPGPTRTNPTNKRLTLFHNRPVKYINDVPCYDRPDGNGWERIWFPNGVENVKLEDVQPRVEMYSEEVKQAYRNFAETGRFEVGRFPGVAPMREWIAFDF